MIDLLLKLIDQIVKLLKERDVAKRHWFDDVVQPIFERFEPVAKEYIDFFRTAEELAQAAVNQGEQGDKLLGEAISILKKKRAETLLARRVVQKLSKAAANVVPSNIYLFCHDVQTLFYRTGIYEQGPTLNTFWISSGLSQKTEYRLRPNGRRSAQSLESILKVLRRRSWPSYAGRLQYS